MLKRYNILNLYIKATIFKFLLNFRIKKKSKFLDLNDIFQILIKLLIL